MPMTGSETSHRTAGAPVSWPSAGASCSLAPPVMSARCQARWRAILPVLQRAAALGTAGDDETIGIGFSLDPLHANEPRQCAYPVAPRDDGRVVGQRELAFVRQRGVREARNVCNAWMLAWHQPRLADQRCLHQS